MNIEEEIIELQTRVAFQEDTINQLNLVVSQQDSEIMLMKEQLRQLLARFQELQNQQVGTGVEITNERPPHY